jgi:hypothetical protein
MSRTIGLDDHSARDVANPSRRPTRRIGSVVALFSAALLGAVLVLHQGLVWPLVIACGFAVIGAVAFLLQVDAHSL